MNTCRGSPPFGDTGAVFITGVGCGLFPVSALVMGEFCEVIRFDYGSYEVSFLFYSSFSVFFKSL